MTSLYPHPLTRLSAVHPVWITQSHMHAPTLMKECESATLTSSLNFKDKMLHEWMKLKTVWVTLWLRNQIRAERTSFIWNVPSPWRCWTFSLCKSSSVNSNPSCKRTPPRSLLPKSQEREWKALQEGKWIQKGTQRHYNRFSFTQQVNSRSDSREIVTDWWLIIRWLLDILTSRCAATGGCREVRSALEWASKLSQIREGTPANAHRTHTVHFPHTLRRDWITSRTEHKHTSACLITCILILNQYTRLVWIVFQLQTNTPFALDSKCKFNSCEIEDLAKKWNTMWIDFTKPNTYFRNHWCPLVQWSHV